MILRTRRILAHGWQDVTLSVLTLGHYPASVANGKLCTVFVMVTPNAVASLALPVATFAVAIPDATITVESC